MTRVYVGNLPPGIREDELGDEFRRHGPVRSIWVARKPPGFAFVEYEDPRDASDAVRKIDGYKGWRVELSRGGKGGGGMMDRRDRYDSLRGRSPARSPLRKRSPSYDRYRRRSPSYERRRRSRTRSRSPRRSPSPVRRRTRSPSPVKSPRSPRSPPRSPRSPPRSPKSPRD